MNFLANDQRPDHGRFSNLAILFQVDDERERWKFIGKSRQHIILPDAPGHLEFGTPLKFDMQQQFLALQAYPAQSVGLKIPAMKFLRQFLDELGFRHKPRYEVLRFDAKELLHGTIPAPHTISPT